MRNNLMGKWSLGAAGLALALGCAGQQKTETKRTVDDDQVTSAAGGPDEVTAVMKAQAKQPEASVTADQRADFEKAVANYQKLKKGGVLKGGDCDDAAGAFRRVADQNPQLLIARHNEAAVYQECGREKDAMRIWEDLGRKGYGAALSSLGFAALREGQTTQAESYFERAIAADPQLGSIAARINLAQILREKARKSPGSAAEYIDRAAKHLRAVLALDGSSLQAYANLCYLLYDYGRPDGALLVARQAIKRAEEIATGRFEDEVIAETVTGGAKGKGKGKKGEDKGADEAKAKETKVEGTGWTPEMKKHIAVVYNTLGLIYLNRKIYSDAIASFKKAVENDPSLNAARMNLAAVSLRFRDYVTAEENFRAVAASDPRNYAATLGLGVALRGNRKFDDAEQQYNAAIKVDPSNPDAYFNLGLLYQEYRAAENPDKAILQKAQAFYRDYISRAGSSNARLRRDAEKRIKDIDELFVALQEAEKLQKEAEELQKKAEEQQKKMEEQLKKQEEEEKKKGGGAAPAPGPDKAGAGTSSTEGTSLSPPSTAAAPK